MNEIEINTSSLSGDIESLENTLRQLERQIGRMFDTVTDLDRMWDGPSNDAFNLQFSRDHQSCIAMCHVLDELIKSLKHARAEYEKCDRDVNSMIQSIQIQ